MLNGHYLASRGADSLRKARPNEPPQCFLAPLLAAEILRDMAAKVRAVAVTALSLCAI